jgi:hypothetical protein
VEKHCQPEPTFKKAEDETDSGPLGRDCPLADLS